MIDFNSEDIIRIKGVNSTEIKKHNRVCIISYKRLNEVKWLVNGFSTRIGGVSKGIYEEMNLSFTQGDEDANVRKNFEIIGDAMGVDVADMVYSHQTHTANIMRVYGRHKGMGIISDRDFSDIDGLITNEPGVCLVTSYADCVPLYFADIKNRAIGLSHSGWRGTVSDICHNTVMGMAEEFGSSPSDIIACIGPSICQDCYEVSRDVADRFIEKYDDSEHKDILRKKSDEKYMLNLHMANYYNMIHAGIPKENISMPDLCTCCNKKWLHSHRGSLGKRGGLCAFLQIKNEY